MKLSSRFLRAATLCVAGFSGVLSVAVLVAPAQAASATMTNVDEIGTFAPVSLTGINSSGVVVGTAGAYGLVRTPDGMITNFDARGSTSSDPANWGTRVAGINAGGQITGTTSSDLDSIHDVGFLREIHGTVTYFGVPGMKTHPASINNKGDITGAWIDSINATHGFVRLAARGQLIQFDVPGSLSTIPYCINGHRDVVGLYYTPGNVPHGFLRTADGTITTIGPPNSIASIATAINWSGEITGEYTTDGVNYHAYVRNGDGSYTSFDAVSGETAILPTGINFGGEVVGYLTYNNTEISQHMNRAFFRKPNGTIHVFDAPPFTAVPNPPYPPVSTATVSAVNNAGVIIGHYDYYQENFGHSFIRTP